MSTKVNSKTNAKKPKSTNKAAVGFWARHKRLWCWLGGILGAIVLIILSLAIWMRLSPWPGAMVIRWVFENNSGAQELSQVLESHNPQGVNTISDEQYRPDDKDAKLDVHMPENIQDTDKKLPVVIWTHGGAWLSGSKDDAEPYFRLMAKQGYIVVAPNYSLAPDYTYPRPIHQLNAAHQYIIDNAERFHVDTSKIVLAGDSAGSQLSAQMAAVITNPEYASEVGITPSLKSGQLKGVLLNCGVYDMDGIVHPEHEVSRVLGWGNDVTVWAYSGTRDFSDPIIQQMSPILHVTQDFPPAFITGGNDDPLTDAQSKPLADKLQKLDVPTSTLFYPAGHQPKLPHEYQFDLNLADAQNAFKQMGEFLRQYTK
jgi:acetyl esterase